MGKHHRHHDLTSPFVDFCRVAVAVYGRVVCMCSDGRGCGGWLVGWPAGRMAVAVAGWPGGCLRVVGRPAGRMAGPWPDGRAMPKLCRAGVGPRLASALLKSHRSV